jgi:hypothetical protein
MKFFCITQGMLQVDEDTHAEAIERHRSFGLGTAQGSNKGVV